jgi:phosphoglycolate phosphatase-like HAD superfamily hydrolase
MKYTVRVVFLLIFFLLGWHPILPESVVFDLGGVLIHTDSVTTFREIGVRRFVAYLATGKNPLTISQTLRTRFYGFLDTIFPNKSNHDSCDEHGAKLPILMYCWLKGTLTTPQIKNLITTGTRNYPEYFKSNAEKNIILAIARLTFTPEKLVATRVLNKAALLFMRSCKEGGHSVYILSNWDPDSFELLEDRFPQLFDLCDGVIISGTIHSTKPENTIYQTLLDTYELDPTQTIFLDDRPENLETAQKHGIATIHCSKNKVKTFDYIYDEINAWLQGH